LAENDIIIRDITDKIQQMTVRGNHEITANTSKSEEGEADRNP